MLAEGVSLELGRVRADLHDDRGALFLVGHVDDLLDHVVGVRVADHHLQQGRPDRKKDAQDGRPWEGGREGQRGGEVRVGDEGNSREMN